MIVTGVAVQHPEQIVYRGFVFPWNGTGGTKFRTDVDGSWRVEVDPGEYGVVYYGLQRTYNTEQRWTWSKTNTYNATWQDKSPYSIQVKTANVQFLPYIEHRCQPVCHGPYLFEE